MTGAAIAVGVVVLGMLVAGFVVASGRRGEAERHEWWVERCGGRAVVHGGPEDVSAGLQRAAAREYPKAVLP